ARICAVLAGDLHHYSRYTAPAAGTSFITAGGGGAYFSPTHYLKSFRRLSWLGNDTDITLKCRVEDGKATDATACWPSRTTSRRLSLNTLAFPFMNYGFAISLGVFYWLMVWIYATTRFEGGPYKGSSVNEVLLSDQFRFRDLFLVTPLAAAT